MSNKLFESEIEQIALNLLREENKYSAAFGPDISEGENKGTPNKKKQLKTCAAAKRPRQTCITFHQRPYAGQRCLTP